WPRQGPRTPAHTGAAAPHTATTPLGTHCSAQKTIAQLQARVMRPTTTATPIVRLPRGNGCRSATATTVRSEATATARTHANTNGGTSFTPIFIAPHVEPQVSATVTYSTATRSGGIRER